MVSVIYNTVTSFSGDYSNDLEQLSPIPYVITSDTKPFWQNYSEVASPESVSQLFRKCLKNNKKNGWSAILTLISIRNYKKLLLRNVFLRCSKIFGKYIY